MVRPHPEHSQFVIPIGHSSRGAGR